MEHSKSYVLELLEEVFGQNKKPTIAPQPKAGKISDASLELHGETSPNNYSVTFVKDILYSDSGKDRNIIIGCDDENCNPWIVEKGTVYKPLLNKEKVYTDEKGSFNIKSNGCKMVINTPNVNGVNFCTDPETIQEYGVCEIQNNTHFFVVNPETKITEKFYREVKPNQILFSGDTEFGRLLPFNMHVVHDKMNRSVNLSFKNNPETNVLNEPMTIGKFEIHAKEENNNRPYIKFDGKWHASTTFESSINLEAKDYSLFTETQERTANDFIEFNEFVQYRQYTNYNDNRAKTPILQAIRRTCDISESTNIENAEIYSVKRDKIHLNGKVTATANVIAEIAETPSEGCTEQLIKMKPTNNTTCMTSGNITLCPCDGKRPYIWYTDDEHEIHPLNHTQCPANGIVNVKSAENPTKIHLWEIIDENLPICEKGPFVSYLLFKDYMINTECEDGICDATRQIADSKLIPGWITVNEKLDRNGVYYSTQDLSLETLDENMAFNPGTVIMDIAEYCNDNLKLKLVRLENRCDPIMFNRNVYDLYTNELISTEPINITCPTRGGGGRQALYIISQHINNNKHVRDTTLEERFIFTNFNHTDGVLFSAENIPFEELMGEHGMSVMNCNKCTEFNF